MDFEHYVAEHGDALLRHATIVTADPHLAQDLTQAVLERALSGWAPIARMDYPDAYLRRMVVNEFLSARRRVRRLVFTGHAVEQPAAADHAEQQTDRGALIGEMRKLPHRQRVALALRYWDGLSHAEIGSQLGCSEATARSYVARALQHLRAEFEAPTREPQTNEHLAPTPINLESP